jgi:hypothetical protein
MEKSVRSPLGVSHTRFAVFLNIDLEISRICMFFSGFQQAHVSSGNATPY